MDYYQTMRNDYVHKAMYPEVNYIFFLLKAKNVINYFYLQNAALT